MAYAFEVICLLAGVVALVVGYRRNRRNVMLLAALLLLVSSAGPDMVRGFIDGYQAQMPAA